eukprot:9426752-Ditylum_brightwellii.AAC.1
MSTLEVHQESSAKADFVTKVLDLDGASMICSQKRKCVEIDSFRPNQINADDTNKICYDTVWPDLINSTHRSKPQVLKTESDFAHEIFEHLSKRTRTQITKENFIIEKPEVIDGQGQSYCTMGKRDKTEKTCSDEIDNIPSLSEICQMSN